MLSPSSLEFPDQQVGTIGIASAALLSNAGSTCLEILGISATHDFTQSNNCGTGLPAGSSCNIAVRFEPLSAGARTGTLSVSSNFGGALQTALSGNGVVPIAGISPGPLNFGSQVLTTASSSQSLTITNTGSGSLHISTIGISGDFLQTGLSCVGFIAPGGNCAVYSRAARCSRVVEELSSTGAGTL
jgi:hypothetical protein